MIDVSNAEQLMDCAARRPDYTDLAINSREALACYYEGMPLRLLIMQYPKEEDGKFTWRRERMLEMYDNYVKEISESYVEGVFRTKGPERKTGNINLDLYLAGEYDEWFLQELAPFSLFMPELYVVCDVPKAEGEIVSALDKSKLQGLPYPSIYFPHYCTNLGYDAVGNLEWACFHVDMPPEVSVGGALPAKGVAKSAPGNSLDSKGEKEKKPEARYDLYTNEFKVRFNQDGVVEELIEHGYGFLPVVRIAYRQNRAAIDPARTGHAFMHTITKLSLGGLSAKGALQDFQYYALFPKMVLGTETSLNVVEDGAGPATPIRTPSVDSTGRKETDPYYMRAPTDEFEALERIAYERIPTAVYRAARLRDRQTTKTRAMESSGFSKMFDMVPELGVLKAVARYLQRADLAVCKMLYALTLPIAQKGDTEKVQVTYPVSFDTKSLSETMSELVEGADAMKTLSLPSSPTGTLEIAKRWYKAEIPDMPQSFYDEVYGELEEVLKLSLVAIDDLATKKTTLTESEPSDSPTIGEPPSFPAVPATGSGSVSIPAENHEQKGQKRVCRALIFIVPFFACFPLEGKLSRSIRFSPHTEVAAVRETECVLVSNSSPKIEGMVRSSQSPNLFIGKFSREEDIDVGTGGDWLARDLRRAPIGINSWHWVCVGDIGFYPADNSVRRRLSSVHNADANAKCGRAHEGPERCILSVAAFNGDIGSQLSAHGLAGKVDLRIHPRDLFFVGGALFIQCSPRRANGVKSEPCQPKSSGSENVGRNHKLRIISANVLPDPPDDSDYAGSLIVGFLPILGIYTVLFWGFVLWRVHVTKLRTISSNPPSHQFPKGGSSDPLPLRESSGGIVSFAIK